MIHKIKTLLASLGVLTCLSAQAAPVDFSFSFDNLTGNVNGVVTGRILGLQDNAQGQQATSVLIDSYSGLGGVLEDVNASTWTAVLFNSFSVVDGVLTEWRFLAQNLLEGSSDHFGLSSALGAPTCQGNICLPPFISLDNGATIIAHGALTFTAITEQQEVPEPATLALVGLAALGLLASRRKMPGRGRGRQRLA